MDALGKPNPKFEKKIEQMKKQIINLKQEKLHLIGVVMYQYMVGQQ